MKNINRRDFLKAMGASGYFIAQDSLRLPFGIPDVVLRNQLNVPSDQGLMGIFEPEGSFTITARETKHQILAGKETNLWVYEVSSGGKTYINPLIRIKKGGSITAALANDLQESTIIHWHGLNVDAKNDGHPEYAIGPSDSYQYDFTVPNRAGTYWYHSHAHGRTGKQVCYGLAGYFIVEDDEEKQLAEALDLNLGETDIPIVLQDRVFSLDNDFVYTQNPMGSMDGYLGNTVLANLTYKPYLNVSTRMYRFRILNGSNSRIYRLAFVKGVGTAIPVYLIGNDGGLLDKPYQVTEVFLSPGERADVILDLSSHRRGETLWLKSLPYFSADTGMGMMMGGMMQPGSLPNGIPFSILKLNITEKVAYDKKLPSALSTIIPIETSGAEIRQFALSMIMTQGYINGLSFDMDAVPVTVQKGTTEIWEVSNSGFGSSGMPMGMMGMMSMPHPMHIHGFQFQVLKRINSPRQIRGLAVDANGLLPTDKGYKDTVLVWPGETIRFAIDFSHTHEGTQRYLLHCHNLEHSDGGMMINYEVQ